MSEPTSGICAEMQAEIDRLRGELIDVRMHRDSALERLAIAGECAAVLRSSLDKLTRDVIGKCIRCGAPPHSALAHAEACPVGDALR